VLNAPQVLPPLKWAGGKRWLVNQHRHVFPSSFNRYVEPFVGSGAVFFALKPRRAVLADKNEALINFYRTLRNKPEELCEMLEGHAALHSTSHYYKVRGSSPETIEESAANFLYLNRTCWNGLYRENKNGKFNVPIGTKTSVILSTDDFFAASRLLRRARLTASDFEPIIEAAEADDFVFVDPPYTSAHNNNGFIKYNQHIFSWEDQERLASVVRHAVRRGVKVLVTNANHDAIKKLYKRFRQFIVDRPSVIAGSANARAKYEEVIIQCF
jgi:DNA adenine methylase